MSTDPFRGKEKNDEIPNDECGEKQQIRLLSFVIGHFVSSRFPFPSVAWILYAALMNMRKAVPQAAFYGMNQTLLSDPDGDAMCFESQLD